MRIHTFQATPDCARPARAGDHSERKASAPSGPRRRPGSAPGCARPAAPQSGKRRVLFSLYYTLGTFCTDSLRIKIKKSLLNYFFGRDKRS